MIIAGLQFAFGAWMAIVLICVAGAALAWIAAGLCSVFSNSKWDRGSSVSWYKTEAYLRSIRNIDGSKWP